MAAFQQKFYYKIDELHNLANLESLYALDGDSNPELTDHHVLGMDEAMFFKRLLKTAGAQVFKRIHRRGRDVETPYQFDAAYEGDPGYVIFELLFPDNFDSSLVASVDNQILDCLIFHVLSGWFSKVRRNRLADEYKDKYETCEDELKSLIEMRTGVTRAPYFWAKYFETDIETV